MITQIKGLHHVTSLARSASANNTFFTQTLGLRRIKKTVNFDAPDVYHLYYGDEVGTPGSVMTYFPFPNATRGKAGTGEVTTTVFSVPEDSLPWWGRRLAEHAVVDLEMSEHFGEKRLHFAGPDGEALALVEHPGDTRIGWGKGAVPSDYAIRGFHSAQLRVADGGATESLLTTMGYKIAERGSSSTRFVLPSGNGADVIDIRTEAEAASARPGAGSVHHIAFSVEDRAAQLEVRKALMDTGFAVTPVIDRDYFWAIYFRTPGGVLFEIATNEPGFDRDEDAAHLGKTLRLPKQHAHLRADLEASLEPLDD